MNYLKSIHKAGVKNIEMESLSFAALTHHAGIKSAVVCVTIVDRLKGDQVGTSLHYDSITIDQVIF
jgi:uridine phosphorylase